MKKKAVYFFFCAVVVLSISTYAQSWINVGSPGFTGPSTGGLSLVTDQVGTPYVAFMNAENDFKATVMKYIGGSWVIVGHPGFTSAGINYLSLAIDGSGTPYVDFIDGSNAQKTTVMKFDGSNWVSVGSPGFSAGSVMCTGLAIDGNGTPYVVYSTYNISFDSTYGPATVMKFNGSTWEMVGNAGFSAGVAYNTSIATDRGGTPYVVYSDAGCSNFGGATVMKFNGSSWVAVGNAGFSAGEVILPSIVLDSSGTPFVLYQDMAKGGSTVMKYDSRTAVWGTVGAAGLSASVTPCNAIALDNSGIPYVIYEEGYEGPARVVKYVDSSWVNVGVPMALGRYSTTTSIVIDQAGNPYIAYVDSTESNRAMVMKIGVMPSIADKRSLAVKPNPCNGSFILNISSPVYENAIITVTNILGEKIKEVSTTTNTDTQVQIGSPPGIYFISVVAGSEHLGAKIVVK